MRAMLVFLLIFSLWAGADEISDLELSPDSNQKIKKMQINDLSDLQGLTPFESISVIQKRYLPKTFRGELNLSIASIINHTFFYLGGVSGRLGFFVREDHGLGVEAFGLLPPIFKVVTRDLIQPPNSILPFNAVLPQIYAGAYYKWSPVFGKFSVLDQRIIYFDAYMTLGAGAMRTLDGVALIQEQIRRKGWDSNAEGEIANSKPAREFNPVLSLGVGQMFAITQDWAFNWELKWLYTFVQLDDGRLERPVDINLSLGMNYYFPGAKYR